MADSRWMTIYKHYLSNIFIKKLIESCSTTTVKTVEGTQTIAGYIILAYKSESKPYNN